MNFDLKSAVFAWCQLVLTSRVSNCIPFLIMPIRSLKADNFYNSWFTNLQDISLHAKTFSRTNLNRLSSSIEIICKNENDRSRT